MLPAKTFPARSESDRCLSLLPSTMYSSLQRFIRNSFNISYNIPQKQICKVPFLIWEKVLFKAHHGFMKLSNKPCISLILCFLTAALLILLTTSTRTGIVRINLLRLYNSCRKLLDAVKLLTGCFIPEAHITSQPVQPPCSCRVIPCQSQGLLLCPLPSLQ